MEKSWNAFSFVLRIQLLTTNVLFFRELLQDRVKTVLKSKMESRCRKPTRRRVRRDIIIGILEATRYGKLKTHIMQEVNLSFKRLEYYLGHLLSKNLIEKEGRFYRTTERGLGAIEACKICLGLTD